MINRRHQVLFITIFLSCVVLNGCNDSNQNPQDLVDFVKTLQARLNQMKPVQPPQEIFVPPVYFHESNEPSPFLQITGGDAGLRSEDINKEPLEMFPLDALRLVGIILQSNKKAAILATPDNAAYQVTLGTKVGDHQGYVVKIEQDTVVVSEQLPPDEAGLIKQRPVTLRLKDIK